MCGINVPGAVNPSSPRLPSFFQNVCLVLRESLISTGLLIVYTALRSPNTTTHPQILEFVIPVYLVGVGSKFFVTEVPHRLAQLQNQPTMLDSHRDKQHQLSRQYRPVFGPGIGRTTHRQLERSSTTELSKPPSEKFDEETNQRLSLR